MKAVLVLGLLLLAAGCGGGDDDGRLDVLAASSLRDVLPAFDDRPRYVFAGSDALAAQIRDGADADVFVSAQPTTAEELVDAGLAARPVDVASNRLVVIAPKSRSDRIERFDELARPGLKLVLGEEGLPAGDYAREALAAAGLETALENVVSLEDDVRGVLAKVALGEADAGIVYATDVRAAREDVVVIPVPAKAQPRIRYVAVELTDGDRDVARAFVERLRGEEGARVLESFGFTGS